MENVNSTKENESQIIDSIISPKNIKSIILKIIQENDKFQYILKYIYKE